MSTAMSTRMTYMEKGLHRLGPILQTFSRMVSEANLQSLIPGECGWESLQCRDPCCIVYDLVHLHSTLHDVDGAVANAVL